MNRILIRAFHKEEHRMYTGILSITLSETGVVEWVQVSEHKMYPGSDMVVMVSTGLYDREDREIFADDLVKVDAEGAHFLGRVMWNEKLAGFTLVDEIGDTATMYRIDEKARLIIGNIHENPFPMKKLV